MKNPRPHRRIRSRNFLSPNQRQGAAAVALPAPLIRPMARPGRRRIRQAETFDFLKLLGVVVAIFVGYGLLTAARRPAMFTFAAFLVAAFALLPAYIWCRERTTSLPIFPLFCSSFVLTHALQLLISFPRLQENSPEALWKASLTVAGFLFVGTCVWQICVRWPHRQPQRIRVLRGTRGATVLLLVLAASTAFTVADHAGWLTLLPTGIFTALRGFIRGLNNFAVFVLAMRWGARALPPAQTLLFLCLFVGFCIVDISSLFLVAGIGATLMLVVGFSIGRRVVPWKLIAFSMAIAAFLHLGKGEMRERYWGESQGHLIEPQQLPAFFAEWIESSAQQLLLQRQTAEVSPSILARANTIDLLLQAQRMSPEEAPFLNGATYKIIPDALIPRVIHPLKASPHESTTLLNVHYGNQTWEAAQTTSIGWGMLNEAFANFGFAGCFGLAIVLGCFYGLLTRWSIGLPLTSLPALVGIFTMSFALQTEMTAAIFITAYAQGLFALLVLAWLFAERQLHGPATAHAKEAPRGPSI